jgi:PQQ-like domain
MNQDFVTQLRLQLREAALQEERRAPAAQRLVLARRRMPGPAGLAAALAVAMLALAVAIGALSLRGEPEPTKPKVVRSFRVSDGLTSIAPGFGAVWAADLSHSNVLRIDPRTRKVVARIPVAGGEAPGNPPAPSPDVFVTTGAGAVWALASATQNGGGHTTPAQLLRIDPRLNRAVAGIPIHTPTGGDFNPLSVQIADGAVWVIGTGGALQIDPATNATGRYLPTPSAELGVVAEADTVWTLDLDGRLRQVDARSGRTVGAVRVPVTTDTHLFPASPGLLARLSGGRVTRDGRITVFDPGDGHALWHATFEGQINYIAPGSGNTLWVYLVRTPERPDQLVRLDDSTGRRTGQVQPTDSGVAGLARVGRELWVAHPDGRITVVR